MTISQRIDRGAAFALIACFCIAVAASGADTVLLTTGRVLEAESAEILEDGVRIELAAGAVLHLPHEAVDSILSPPARTAFDGGPGAEPFRAQMIETCRLHGVDPTLVAALIEVESNWDPRAESHKGARGLMQLLPDTARAYGVDDLFDPASNLEAGVRHLRRLLDRYDDPHLALAAYNAGEGRVARFRGVPPFEETREYVRRVARLAGLESPDSGMQ